MKNSSDLPEYLAESSAYFHESGEAKKDFTIAVVGGGITGLVAAHALLALSDRCRVTVFERAIPGGRLATRTLCDIPIDVGPDNFLIRRQEAVQLCTALGLKDELVEPKNGDVKILSDGKLFSMPKKSHMGVPVDFKEIAALGLVSKGGLKALKKDRNYPKHQGGDRTIYELVAPRLGEEVLDLLVEPMAAGIHAGLASTLGVSATVPEFLAAAIQHGSLTRGLKPLVEAKLLRENPPIGRSPEPVFYGLKNGMGSIIDRLVDSMSLSSRIEIRVGTEVEAIEIARKSGPLIDKFALVAGQNKYLVDGVIVSTPGPTTGELIKDIEPEIVKQISSIPHASVALATLAYNKLDLFPSHGQRGLLVPRSQGIPITAVTWMSQKWPHLNKSDLNFVRISIGKMNDNSHKSMTEGQLVALASEFLASTFGIKAQIIESRVDRYNEAFPNYAPDHLVNMARLRESVASRGPIILSGPLFGGIGIGSRIADGAMAASRLLKILGEIGSG